MSKKFEDAGKSSHRGKFLLILAVVILVVGVAAGILFIRPSRGEQLQQTLPTETAAPVTTVPPETTEETTEETTLPYTESGKDQFNILIIGQQSRAGGETDDIRLADTLILATINKQTKTIDLTSFLRDTYVKLPDFTEASGKTHHCGRNRINVAYHLGYLWGDLGGAMQMINDCLYNNFGVEVDYDVEVSFDGFIDIVDMLDGIDVELSKDEAAYLNKDKRFVYYEVQPGMQHLDGMAALSYARMRKSNAGDSDISRTSRQRAFITAILEKVRNLDFWELYYLAKDALPMITTNMTDDEIMTLLWEVLPLLPDMEIRSHVIPAKGTWSGKMIDIGGWPSSVLSFNEEKNRAYMEKIRNGENPDEPEETTAPQKADTATKPAQNASAPTKGS